jgi:hypothetical protein
VNQGSTGRDATTPIDAGEIYTHGKHCHKFEVFARPQILLDARILLQYLSSPLRDSYNAVKPKRQESDSCGMISNQSGSIFPKERDQMTDLVAVLEQLKKERAQLDRAITALSPVVGISSGKLSGKVSGRRKLSVAARKRIAAAQRARWAKVRAKKAA